MTRYSLRPYGFVAGSSRKLELETKPYAGDSVRWRCDGTALIVEDVLV